MTVPRYFVGAWERESLEIDGRAVRGIGRAVWIEAGGTYVDVRAPGRVASGTGFGGRSSWRSPRFTWHHDLDLHPRPGTVDRGELRVDGNVIEERGWGVDGTTAAYVERWRRLASKSTAITVMTHARGLAVRVGDHAAVVRPDGARLWQNAGSRWTESTTLGTVPDRPEPSAGGWRRTRGWVTTQCEDRRSPA